MDTEVSLLSAFAERHPSDVAQMLERADVAARTAVLETLSKSLAGAVLARMNPWSAAPAAVTLDPEAAAERLSHAGITVAAAVLRRTETHARAAILDALGKREARGIRELLAQRERSAGAVMDPLIVAVAEDATVGDALTDATADAKHVLYYVYVISRERRLMGVVTLRELLLAERDAPLRSVMRSEPEAVSATATLESLAAHAGWRRYHALPVVDAKHELLGAVRYETVRDVERQLGQAARKPRFTETAEALGEFYALGATGLAEWVTALVGASAASARRGPHA